METGTLNQNSAREVKEIIARLEEVDPDSLAVCTGPTNGSLWDLLVSRAYAASGCVIRFKGEFEGKNLSPEEYAAIRASIVAAAEKEIQSNLKIIQELNELMKGGPLSASQMQEFANAQGRLQEQMAHYALCSDNVTDLRNSGLIPSGYETYLKTAETYRLGGDAIADQISGLNKKTQKELADLRKENLGLASEKWRGIFRLCGQSLELC
ncbi:hypothetical protein, partial [Brucella endophytica]